MKHSVIGMDIAKKVFQLHTVIHALERSNVSSCAAMKRWHSFANYPTRLVAIEVCGSAHW